MSFSTPAPHRSLGLIALVLVVDLGLAGAGAFLLAKGLAKPKPVSADKAPDKKTEARASAPADVATATGPTAAAPAPEPVAAEPAPPLESPADSVAPQPPAAPAAVSAAARTKSRAATPSNKTSVERPTPRAATAPSGPVTSPSAVESAPPVATAPATKPTTAAEVEALTQRSAGGFARCRGDAVVAGTIRVAFNVNPDGSVANAAAVENTTGNAELGQCLAGVIGGWRTSSFEGARTPFVRTFNYP